MAVTYANPELNIRKQKEDVIKDYLNETLFPYLVNSGQTYGVVTHVPTNIDISGADILLVDNTGNYKKVDIKTQFSGLNSPRPTWSFELEYNDKNGDRVDGYFLQCMPGHPDGHDTDVFALVYLDQVKGAEKPKDIMVDNIEQLTVLFVSKDDLVKYFEIGGKDEETLRREAKEAVNIFHDKVDKLKEKGLDTEDNINKARRIKEPFNDSYYNQYSKYNDAYYYVSEGKENMESNSVSVVIRRDALEALPNTKKFVVTPERTLNKTKEIHKHKEAPFNLATLKEMNKTQFSAIGDTDERIK